MGDPLVEPQRWRADVRFLWPDLQRPGLATRTSADAGVLGAADDPESLCAHLEVESPA